MAKEIQLTKGQVVIVCDCCYHKVKDNKWSATWIKSKRQFCAVRRASVKERLLGAPVKIYMHVVINSTPKGLQTDHVNNNSLNNCCNNLRTATHSENQYNRKKYLNNTSGFKGVTWHKQNKKWITRIRLNGKLIHLGYFDTNEDAARARDRASLKYHGEFASLNFPIEDYTYA